MTPRPRQVLIVVTDFVLILAAYLLAYWLRFQGNIPHRNFVPFPELAPLLALLGVLLLATYETHRDLHRNSSDTYASVALAVAVATVAGLALPYLFGAPAFPRSVFLIAAPLEIVLLCLFRWPFIADAQRRLRAQRFVAIGGSAENAERVAQRVQAAFGVAEAIPVASADAAAWFAASAAGAAPVAAVFVGAHASVDARAQAQAWALASGRGFYAVPSLYDVLMLRSSATRVGELPVIQARHPAISADYAWLKRGLDVLGALVFGLIGLPFLAAGALAVKLSSPGAVIYRQVRVGRHGRPFVVAKLRSMVVDAEKETGPVLAGAADPRVTPVGRWLRLLRLDELPQFWNVLRGDMSLVGPRPERPAFVAQFAAESSLYQLRHNARPGLTGLAQVMSPYDVDWEEKLRHDLAYIAQASLLTDLKILVLTLRAVLMPRRAGAFPAWARARAAAARGNDRSVRVGEAQGDRRGAGQVRPRP